MQPSPEFSNELKLLTERPGFQTPSAVQVFVDSAQRLLDTGTSEQEVLVIMDVIHGACTEYFGSFEAVWESFYAIRAQGFTEDQAWHFVNEIRKCMKYSMRQ